MDKTKEKIEQYVEKAEKTHNPRERRQYNQGANQIHEQTTGHAMKFDDQGHLDTSSSDAKKCPALQHQ